MARATSSVHDFSLPSPTLRLLAAVGVSLVLALGLLTPTASADDPEAGPTPTPAATAAPAETTSPTAVDAETAPEAALERAATALLGSDESGSDLSAPEADSAPERVEATVALRDLFLSRSSLGASDERKADSLLARPSDGFSDPYGDGYITAETKKCSRNVCVHWVRAGADAPPSDAWAKKTLTVMEQVWKHHVGTLDYRRPAKDGSRGGNAKFDVYLKELGSRGLYGYCAP